MAELAPLPGSVIAEVPRVGAPASETIRLLDAMSLRAPRSASDIAQRAGFGVDDVRSRLGTLELDGVVVERERGWVRAR
jgi:DNA processing protein